MKTLVLADDIQMRTVIGACSSLPLKTNILADTKPIKTVISHSTCSGSLTLRTVVKAEASLTQTVIQNQSACNRTTINIQKGPMKTVIQYGSRLKTVTHIALSEMPEPPNDDGIYGRKNKQWVPISSTGAVISSDPNNRAKTGTDGGLYVPDTLNPDPLAYYLIARG